MKLIKFIEGGCKAEDSKEYGVYPDSISDVQGGTLFMADMRERDVLVSVNCKGLKGEEFNAGEYKCVLGELCHENAIAVRALLPFTAPSPVLRENRSIGLGDRLGLATDGHIRAMKNYDACPVFVQQSIRELTLTGRSFAEVLDSASFAVMRNGFRRPFGADGDHLKTAEEVRLAIDNGYTMITLDCSNHIHGEALTVPDSELSPADEDLKRRYLGTGFKVEDQEISFDEKELIRIQMVYAEAIEFASEIYREFIDGTELDFELSIDETGTPTTPAQHFFVADELKRRGVRLASIAPRFCGEFQKGIDYIGDIEQYKKEFAVHAAIARSFGYKLSIHSGSDKFSVFPASGRLSRGNFHVKTAGTNWLEAMAVVAEHEPQLYREIHKFALEHFQEARAYYHVTTCLNNIPSMDTLTDAQLPELFENNDSRQLIHITYGLILTAKNDDGSYLFKDRLYKFWRENREEYAQRLGKHIGRHLSMLYSECV